MYKWLTCFIKGHNLVYVDDIRIFDSDHSTLPIKRYRSYECKRCFNMVRKRV